MTIPEFTSLTLALVPYCVVHTIIIAFLFRFRSRLPQQHRTIARWLLVATATPLVGPFVSSIAFARLAGCAQEATADLPAFRSDCGHAAGIAYGLVYFAAAWVQSPALGALSLALLSLFFWQLCAALRALQREDAPPKPLPSLC